MFTRKGTHLILAALAVCALPACRHNTPEYPLRKVTFQVISKSIPDTATIYVTGRSSILGNWDRAFAPLDKQGDGSWRKAFDFPSELKIECKFDLGSPLTEAVDSDSVPLGKLAFTVKQDTTIVVEVANWKDAVLSPQEKLSPRHRADSLVEKARLMITSPPDRKIPYFEQARALYAQALDWEKQIECLIKLGNLWNNKGDLDRSQKFYESALQSAIKKLGENHPSVALAYERLGNFYTDLGDYDKGIEYGQLAINSWKQGYGEIQDELHEPYRLLARTYRLQGKYDRAIAFRQKALAVTIKIAGPAHQDVGHHYRNIGLVYADQADYEQAINYFDQAWKIYSCYPHEANIAAHMFHEELGSIYLRQGDDREAEKHFRQALNIRLQRYGPKRTHTANAYFDLAEVYFKREEFEATLRYVQKALNALVVDFNDTDIAVNPPIDFSQDDRRFLAFLALKAEAFYARYAHAQGRNRLLFSPRRQDLEMALATAKLAAALIDKMRNRNLTEDAKLFLAENSKKIYSRGIQVALKLDELTQEPIYKEEAFQLAERSRAGILQQALQDAEAKRFSGIPKTLLEKERALKIGLTALEANLEKEQQKPTPDNAEKIRALHNRHLLLQNEYKAWRDNFEREYPDYFQLKYQSQVAAIADLQRALDEQTAILEYFVDEQTVYLFLITKNTFEVVALPVDKNFSAEVGAYFAAVKRALDRQDFLRQSAKLYAALIKPIAGSLVRKKKLVIIPDDILFFVPFEALVAAPAPNQRALDFKEIDFLIKHFEISYHYSATQYHKNAMRQPATDPPAENLVAFAPVFGQQLDNGYILTGNRPALAVFGGDPGESWVTRDGARLHELKYSEAEVQTIVKLFDGQRRESAGFLHRQATEANFKRHAAQGKYLHISTHGFVNADKPRFSGLAFSQPRDSTGKEDGIFYAAEAYNLNLNADLVVLSSCESGMGKLAKGEGIMALTRGFLYSGAKNMVVSLWKVFDEHTSQLMIEFYKGVVAGKSYSAALREAKLKMMQNPNTAFPASWAGFVLIGK